VTQVTCDIHRDSKYLTQYFLSYIVGRVRAPTVDERAARHAALGDPVRLAMVDALAHSDLASVELQERFDISSNLLAHHLDVLERAGLIARTRSSGDGRRRYVHLLDGVFEVIESQEQMDAGPVLFVCTANSARSQLAAALWTQLTRTTAESAGTHPASTIAPGALTAAKRAGLDLEGARPRSLSTLRRVPARVITVCDQAHEELEPGPDWLHWSIVDPVPLRSRAAFDATVVELRRRITAHLPADRVAS
jgi:protein-tyrosine-phosphatase